MAPSVSWTTAVVSKLDIYETTGYTSTGLTCNTGGSTGTALSTTSTSFSGSPFLVAAYAANSGSGAGETISAGTGFTLSDTSSKNDGGSGEYATSGITSPTTFPATGTKSVAWAGIGCQFPVATQIVSNTVMLAQAQAASFKGSASDKLSVSQSQALSLKSVLGRSTSLTQSQTASWLSSNLHLHSTTSVSQSQALSLKSALTPSSLTLAQGQGLSLKGSLTSKPTLAQSQAAKFTGSTSAKAVSLLQSQLLSLKDGLSRLASLTQHQSLTVKSGVALHALTLGQHQGLSLGSSISGAKVTLSQRQTVSLKSSVGSTIHAVQSQLASWIGSIADLLGLSQKQVASTNGVPTYATSTTTSTNTQGGVICPYPGAPTCGTPLTTTGKVSPGGNSTTGPSALNNGLDALSALGVWFESTPGLTFLAAVVALFVVMGMALIADYKQKND
ncbi:MAG: hypothetical protein KGI71_04520 [Patescibacteria group bacterium]|nr:hypothetical protein [Patescibacteria group bacterium]